MASYESFARVYDLFMDNIPYEEWCGYLHTLLEKYDVTDGLVLELGCGTGTMTELLARLRYDMIGVDKFSGYARDRARKEGTVRKRHFIFAAGYAGNLTVRYCGGDCECL